MACGRKGNCICLHLLEFTGNSEGCEGLEGGGGVWRGKGVNVWRGGGAIMERGVNYGREKG